MDPLVSVVITNFNGKQFLEPCLSSLYRQSASNFEIILVDNGSTDGSTGFVREKFPDVSVIETGKNLGFAGGTNVGIRASRGKFILTLNNDTVTDPQYIDNLTKPMLSDPGLGMCASKMLLPDGTINSAGICISRSGAALDRGISEIDTGNYQREEDVFGPCAGAALYRRSMLDEIGLFDEDFYLYMEDVDLAFRGRMAGWNCRYIPSAKVFHFLAGTTGKKSDITIFYCNRNLVWNVFKNFPVRTFFLYLPWILIRNCTDVLYYLTHGKGRIVFKAKVSAIGGIIRMLRKRKEIARKVPEKQIRKWLVE